MLKLKEGDIVGWKDDSVNCCGKTLYGRIVSIQEIEPMSFLSHEDDTTLENLEEPVIYNYGIDFGPEFEGHNLQGKLQTDTGWFLFNTEIIPVPSDYIIL